MRNRRRSTQEPHNAFFEVQKGVGEERSRGKEEINVYKEGNGGRNTK